MLRKLQGLIREFGFAAACLYAVHRALQRVSPEWRLYVYELMVQPITGHAALPRKLGSQLEIREIGANDAEIAQMPVRPEVMEARLRQNATCLGAFRKGELVGYMWFCSQQYEEDEVRCTYLLGSPKDSVFDFDFYIFPDHRMGLAFVALWNGANSFLSSRGIRYTFSRLTRFNTASRRAHRHFGWKRVGRALFLRLGRFELMLATIAPYVAASVTASSRVRLTLHPDALRAPANASDPDDRRS